jgi:hypothetical protein
MLNFLFKKFNLNEQAAPKAQHHQRKRHQHEELNKLNIFSIKKAKPI